MLNEGEISFDNVEKNGITETEDSLVKVLDTELPPEDVQAMKLEMDLLNRDQENAERIATNQFRKEFGGLENQIVQSGARESIEGPSKAEYQTNINTLRTELEENGFTSLQVSQIMTDLETEKVTSEWVCDLVDLRNDLEAQHVPQSEIDEIMENLEQERAGLKQELSNLKDSIRV